MKITAVYKRGFVVDSKTAKSGKLEVNDDVENEAFFRSGAVPEYPQFGQQFNHQIKYQKAGWIERSQRIDISRWKQQDQLRH